MLKIITILLLFVSSVNTKTAELTIIIDNIPNDNGVIIIGICDSKDNFPKKPFIRKSISIKNGIAKIILKDLNYGEYAISIIHDENNNGKLDFHFYGPPKEKTSASNNASSFFGPPAWEDAKFVINKSIIEHKISM